MWHQKPSLSEMVLQRKLLREDRARDRVLGSLIMAFIWGLAAIVLVLALAELRPPR